jgi:hypothetical protein
MQVTLMVLVVNDDGEESKYDLWTSNDLEYVEVRKNLYLDALKNLGFEEVRKGWYQSKEHSIDVSFAIREPSRNLSVDDFILIIERENTEMQG